MAPQTKILTQFNSGELSPLMSGRVDVEAYQKGARSMMNFIPTVQGPAKRRAGTRFLGITQDVNGDGVPALLVDFVRSATEAYVIEIVGNFMRFWYNGAVIFGPIGVPYLQADLFDADGIPLIQAVQDADVVYFVHPKYPVYKLQHFSPTNWFFSAPFFKDGPWLPENSDVNNFMQVSNYFGGGILVTATADTFTPHCAGQLIRIFQSDLSQLHA